MKTLACRAWNEGFYPYNAHTIDLSFVLVSVVHSETAIDYYTQKGFSCIAHAVDSFERKYAVYSDGKYYIAFPAEMITKKGE